MDLDERQLYALRAHHKRAVASGDASAMIRKGYEIRDLESADLRLLTDEEITLITEAHTPEPYRPAAPDCPVQWWEHEANPRAQNVLKDCTFLGRWKPDGIDFVATDPDPREELPSGLITHETISKEEFKRRYPGAADIIVVDDPCTDDQQHISGAEIDKRWLDVPLFRCHLCSVPLDGVTQHKGDCKFNLYSAIMEPVAFAPRPEPRKVSWWTWLKWWFTR